MAGMIKKGIMLYFVMAILSALVSFVGGTVLGVIMGVMIFASYLLLMYSEGCVRGEHACSIRDIIARLKSEGKEADSGMLKQTYDPSVALKACIIIAAPLLILAVVNLIKADPSTASESPLGVVARMAFLPEAFITRICTESVKIDTQGAQTMAASVISAFDFGSVDVSAIVAASQSSYAYAYGLEPLTIMRICYIPASILPALAMYIGYLRGPAIRKKTVDDMMSGARKKQKKLKVFSRQRKVRQVKPEV